MSCSQGSGVWWENPTENRSDSRPLLFSQANFPLSSSLLRITQPFHFYYCSGCCLIFFKAIKHSFRPSHQFQPETSINNRLVPTDLPRAPYTPNQLILVPTSRVEKCLYLSGSRTAATLRAPNTRVHMATFHGSRPVSPFAPYSVSQEQCTLPRPSGRGNGGASYVKCPVQVF